MFILSITFRGNSTIMGVLLIYQPGVMNRRLKPFNYCMSHNRMKSPKPAFRLPRQLPKHICYMPTHVQTTYQFGMHMQMRDTRRPLNMSSHPEVPVHPQTDSVGPSCGPLFRMVWMWPICQPKLKAHIAGKEQRAWSLDRAVSAWCFTMSSKILLSKYMCFQMFESTERTISSKLWAAILCFHCFKPWKKMGFSQKQGPSLSNSWRIKSYT